jgi:23S rRNA U2552 (ribose-2'-O)-methylase RlmE/FtsJ
MLITGQIRQSKRVTEQEQVYKLEEILKKQNLIRKSQNVLDLGSAPGGWSHYIKKKSPNSEVYAIDYLRYGSS